LLAKRDEATLFYSQGLGTRNGLALEIQQTGAIEHFQDVYTWGDLKVGASWSFLRSRYGSASLFGGCMVPTGNEYDWFESHGGFTPYLGLRFSRAFWFFAVNASSEAQLTVGPGENQVKGADPEKVENHYFSSRTSADITYRVCRFFRLGVEQKINYHRWTADGPNLVQQTVSDTPTSLVTDWTILPSARIHLFYGYDFISNREGFDANDTRTFGGGFSCAF
jgi:hypothetical protein